MPLADLQMPSITGSEAVDKYIYIPERPPDNQILIQFCYSQSDSEKTTQSRFSNAPPFIWRKTWLIWSIYDEHSPYATVYHPILPETFTAVPNRQHSLSDIHQKPPTHSSCLYLCADISAGDLVILGVWESALSPQKSNCLSVSEFWLLGWWF